MREAEQGIYQDRNINFPCRVYSPDGLTYREVRHDWRMHSREPREEYKTINQENALGWGNVNITRVGWDEVWYCTVCRHVENRFVPE